MSNARYLSIPDATSTGFVKPLINEAFESTAGLVPKHQERFLHSPFMIFDVNENMFIRPNTLMQMELEADDDLASGKFKDFETVDEAIADLQKLGAADASSANQPF